MDARDMERTKLARQVARLLLDADFRGALVVRDEAGERPIVVVLADDTVKSMFARVDNAGGSANVLAKIDGRIAIISVFDEHSPNGVHVPEEDHCPVSPDTHVDMLVTYLKRQPGPVRCQVVAPDHEFHLVRELDATNGPPTLQDA